MVKNGRSILFARAIRSAMNKSCTNARFLRLSLERQWLEAIVLLHALFLFVSLLASIAHAQVKPVRRVLIIHEVGAYLPLSDYVDRGIRTSFDSSPNRIVVNREFMRAGMMFDDSNQQVRTFIVDRYRSHQPDVIIVVGQAPLQFIIEVHEKAFRGVPIVFCLPDRLLASLPEELHFTGVVGDIAAAQTLDAALRLRPGTKHVVVIGGVGDVDLERNAAIQNQLKSYEDHLKISYLTGIPVPDLVQRLQNLPNNTIVLLGNLGLDSAGNLYSTAESGAIVAGSANVPVFSLIDRSLNHGEVGGKVSDSVEQGKIAGGMALRILNGEQPQNIPIMKDVTTYMFDWRALQRWGFKESNLPPGSLVLNRQPSIWELYKWYIIGGTALVLLESLLISALLWQRTRRRKAEAEQAAALEKAKESEQRFRFVANAAPVMIWMAGTDTLCTYVNQSWLDFTGRSIEQELGSGWTEGLHPEDVDRCLRSYTNAFDRRQPFTMEYRIRRHNGEYCWVLDHGLPRYNPDGSFLGYIGSVIDIAQRKQAEEALSSVSRRLIEAQEIERAHIARELHDDVGQRLALIAVNLETAKQRLAASESQERHRIDETHQQVYELASTVHALSHQLHSSKLNILGVVAACAGFCREFSERHDVKVDFQPGDVPKVLPPEISICLFRILQEALQNALKHSGVRHYQVSLVSVSNVIHLSVQDAGFGFDPEQAMCGEGLGLTSMRERLKLVDGELTIESNPQHGTTVTACVPFHAAAMVAKVGRT